MARVWPNGLDVITPAIKCEPFGHLFPFSGVVAPAFLAAFISSVRHQFLWVKMRFDELGSGSTEGTAPTAFAFDRPTRGEGDAKAKAEGADRNCREEEEAHPAVQPVRLECLKLQRTHRNSQDAAANDPQSAGETQVIRVRNGPVRPETWAVVCVRRRAPTTREPAGVRRLQLSWPAV